jgi:hypothetical protein
MERIIAGRFQTKDEADAVAYWIAQYVEAGDICIFHNNPPGQHGVLAGGGDEAVDPGAVGAGQLSVGTAIATALTAGAMGAVGGPVVAIAAAATGAYVGSLAGALDGLGNHDESPARRPAGIILSVRIANPVNENRVIDTLRAEGAADIERAEGEWCDGDWVDFNPVAAPQLVEVAPH